MKHRLEDLGALALIALFYIVLEMLLGIGCPFKFLTGISDAGCGMSRAFAAVLRGDFPRAFYFHPLWMLRERIPRVLYQGLLGLMIAAFLLVWIARFFIPGQDIVVFAPWNGLVGRLLRLLFTT